MKKTLLFVLVAAAAFSAEGYKVLNKIQDRRHGRMGLRRRGPRHAAHLRFAWRHCGGGGSQGRQGGGTDHATARRPRHRDGARLNKGFITNGQSNSVTIFDLKTLAKTGEPAVGGQNPDAICYEPKTKRIFTFNGRSPTIPRQSTPRTTRSSKTFPIGEKPENCAVDGAGKLYVNIENSSEMVEIDAAKPGVTRRASLAPCEGPSGLAIDVKNKKLFSVCGNKMMAVTDIATHEGDRDSGDRLGRRRRGLRFGHGLAFSSNGDGTMTIVKLVNGKYEAVDTRDHRARRAHDDGGPDDTPRAICWRPNTVRRRQRRKARRRRVRRWCPTAST